MITIIVLLILAVVAIRAVQGDGIIQHAKNARDEYEQAQVNEQTTLEGYLGKIEENIPKTPSNAFSTITEENYGDKVAYSAGGVNDWKVFYKDESNLYIITSDYLENKNLPTGIKMSKYTDTDEYPYSAYWEDTNAFTSTGASDITTAVANKYGLSWLNGNASSTNDNARATADLLNTTAWTAKFGDTSKGIEAVGGPTLEMWVKSWNAKSTVQLKIENNETGYYVGPTTTESLSSVADEYDETKGGYAVYVSSDTNLWKDGSLYFPHTSVVNNCYGYWLASPSASDYSQVMNVYNFYDVSTSGYVNITSYDDDDLGVRPVVSIPSNLIGNKDASGAWTVTE